MSLFVTSNQWEEIREKQKYKNLWFWQKTVDQMYFVLVFQAQMWWILPQTQDMLQQAGVTLCVSFAQACASLLSASAFKEGSYKQEKTC